ncbi:MAG TPA: molybdenum cofactor guanylyltransferase [Pyrinomonadaceae bacterium]|jgi:molybdopterin-guanine dinucleotide biosynthesis protein A
MTEIEGFILVGGKSSRMGSDKAQLRLGSQSFVEKIAEALASITETVSVVGVKAERVLGRWPVVPDVHVEWGALGGLHAALRACRSEWAAIVACDLPFVTGELFARLASLRENFEAVVPVQVDGRLQPLCALYRTGICLSRAEELIAAGERRPRVLFERVRERRVAHAELADLSGAELFFTNVNTPSDYAHAQAQAGDKC